MDVEFKALVANHTWTLVPFQGQNNIIDSKWVFKTKYKAYGSIQQTAGLDYDETFSPVVTSSIVRIVLSITVHLNWEVGQLDINNAFLNGNLKENVFMHQPEGYTDSTNPGHKCKLNKTIYGLKQAPRALQDKLKDTLVRWGFQNTKSDLSLFVLKENDHIILLRIYVDDIIITGSNNKSLETFITQLNIALLTQRPWPSTLLLGN